MKCMIDITAATDVAAWVTRDAFIANIDPGDLACRESKDVLDWYHPDWFRRDDNGELYFTPPAFEFRSGRLLGILESAAKYRKNKRLFPQVHGC